MSNKWFNFDLDDVDSAEIMLREKKYNNVCYFSHQSVEKALKGVLEHNGVNPPRIHDLIELINQCKAINEDFSQYISQVRKLNQFYIPTRYPVAPIGSTSQGMPDKPIAEKSLNYAKEIVEYCRAFCE